MLRAVQLNLTWTSLPEGLQFPGLLCQVQCRLSVPGLDVWVRNERLLVQVRGRTEIAKRQEVGHLILFHWSRFFVTRIPKELPRLCYVLNVIILKGISGLRSARTCSQEVGFVYYYDDISQPLSLAAPGECCSRCGHTAGCVAYRFLSLKRNSFILTVKTVNSG